MVIDPAQPCLIGGWCWGQRGWLLDHLDHRGILLASEQSHGFYDRRMPSQHLEGLAEEGLAGRKAELRAEVRARRAAGSAEQRAERDRSRTARVLDLIATLDAGSDADRLVLAAYASIEPEPDTHPLLDALLARGHRILLPVLSPLPGGRARRDPAWAWCTDLDELRPGLWGIPEPATEVLGQEALAEVALVLAPALAAGLDGTRLGTGGGWYDRALTARQSGTPVVVLLNDDEVHPTVPHDERDQRVDVVVTEHRVLRR